MNQLRTDILRQLSVQSSNPETFTARWRVNDGFIGFQGHFPGNPVLPGVCLVQASLLACQGHLGTSVELVAMHTVKFFAPVLPGTTLILDGSLMAADGGQILNVRITDAQHKISQLKLKITGGPDESCQTCKKSPLQGET